MILCKYTVLVRQVFCSELPVFMREHHNGMYRTDVYFLSKTFAELPIFLAIPVLFTCVMYYMVGLNPKIDHFLLANLFITLVSLVAVSFGKCPLTYARTNRLGLSKSVYCPLVFKRIKLLILRWWILLDQLNFYKYKKKKSHTCDSL